MHREETPWQVKWGVFLTCALRRRVQNRADLVGQALNGKRLLNKVDTGFQNAMVQDDVIGVPGHVENF